MKITTDKLFLKNSKTNILYRNALRKSCILFLWLFFISIVAGGYLYSSIYSHILLSKVSRTESNAKLGIKDFKINHRKQIICFKNRIKKSNLDSSKVYKMHTDKSFSKLFITCSSLVLNTIIIDRNRRVLFSNFKLENGEYDLYSDEELGFKFSELRKLEKESTIGSVKYDKNLNKQYFYILSPITDKNGNFFGAVIFKISVDDLKNKLVPQRNRGLIIRDSKVDISSDSLYKKLKAKPEITFLENVILKNNPIIITQYNKSLKKYLEYRYDPQGLRKSFFQSMLISGIIMIIVLFIVFYYYYRYILLPIRESLEVIQNGENYNDKLNYGISVFSSLNKFNLSQSALISKQEIKHREQFAKIISIIFSIGSLSHYITSKIEMLKEDISDIKNVSDKNSVKSFNKRLKNIEQTIENSENDIKSLTTEFTKFTQLIKNQSKEDISISRELIEEEVKDKLNLQNYYGSIEITESVKIDIHVYKSFFKMLIDEILNFNVEDLVLKCIKIEEDKKLQFIFKKVDTGFVDFQNEQVTLCKMIGMFNDIDVSILQDQENIIIELDF